jgi:integrase
MGRLCQNVTRRNGVYWFTKKIRTPAGVRRVEFSLSVRQPELATMVAAQVSAQFHLLSHHVVSGQIDIKNFQRALAEVATDVAASRRESILDKLIDPSQTPADATGPDGMEVLLRAEVGAGRLIELIARHGEAMRDASFFIGALDDNGFDDEEIRVCVVTVLPIIDDVLALLVPPDTAEMREAIANGYQPISPFLRRAVMTTIGRTIAQSARTAAEQDLFGIDAIANQAAAGAYDQPPLASTPSPAAVPVPVGEVQIASPDPVTKVNSVDEHPFVIAMEAFLKRVRKGAARRDSKDVIAIGRLFAEFLMEQDVHDLRQLRQQHLAGFQELFDELPTHWGKSSQDTCLADYRKRGASLPAGKRGLSAKTLNKHFSNIGQVIDSIRATGGIVSAPGEVLDASLLRISIKNRGRNLRNPFAKDELIALFSLPAFTGCAGWDRRNPFKPGPHVFHRALYFAPILLYYTGARRDEICGLVRDDIYLDAPIPYIHIRENAQRHIKNDQSERKIPIHSEVLRLGFAEYVHKIRDLRYALVFPDLHSPTTSSPLGDRLYDEIAGALAEVVPEEGRRKKVVPEEGRRKKVLHSLRHTVGSSLKGSGIVSEMRADLLGHKGKTATEETYSENAALKDLRDLIHKLPIVTEHLSRQPIKLVPWVARREPAPWGRSARAVAEQKVE